MARLPHAVNVSLVRLRHRTRVVMAIHAAKAHIIGTRKLVTNHTNPHRQTDRQTDRVKQLGRVTRERELTFLAGEGTQTTAPSYNRDHHHIRKAATTNDERRTTNDERRTTNDERRRTTNDERRTTNERRRTANDERRRTTNDERRTTNGTAKDEVRKGTVTTKVRSMKLVEKKMECVSK